MNEPKYNSSIVYVNFSPYENSGHILDYLKLHFTHVFLFCLNFHYLGRKQKSNILTIYKNSQKISQYSLFSIPVPVPFMFVLLPIRSLFIFFQLFFYVTFLSLRYGKIEYYFSVNAFTVWIGNVLKKIHLVQKTIFWVWDYYPPIHKNKIIMLMRSIYWQFDKLAIASDKVVFLNTRLKKLREDIGILPKNFLYQIIPIGTKINTTKKTYIKIINLVFIGVLKKSQGFDLFLDTMPIIIKKFPNIQVNVIGSGPDKDYFIRKSKKLTSIHYFGFLPDENKISSIMKQSHIGIAPYIPEESNVSIYGDPSKIKMYLEYGLPVITTDIFAFSEEISKYHAGIVMKLYKPEVLLKSLTSIIKRYDYYKNNAKILAKKYEYNQLYDHFFV
jgi:glycosyltransferase involved in cell wall biosynthesis